MIHPQPESERPGSRLARAAFYLAGFGLLVTFVFVLVSFAWPSSDTGDPSRRILTGNLDNFITGEPRLIVDSDSAATFWLVKLEDGSLVALSATDSRSRCEIAWLDDFMFRDPRDDAEKAGWFATHAWGQLTTSQASLYSVRRLATWTSSR